MLVPALPARELVLNVATPEPFRVPLPSRVAPAKNEAVPVGMPEPEAAVTVAVKVTVEP